MHDVLAHSLSALALQLETTRLLARDRGVDPDVATMTLLERLNDGGEVFLSHTTVGGRAVLRIAVGAPSTTAADVERLWALLCENHDWLASDFAEIAAQRERAEAERRAEIERDVAAKEAAKDAAQAPEDTATPEPTVELPAAQDESAAQAVAQEDLPTG